MVIISFVINLTLKVVPKRSFSRAGNSKRTFEEK